jgi:hypothetical protein
MNSVYWRNNARNKEIVNEPRLVFSIGSSGRQQSQPEVRRADGAVRWAGKQLEHLESDA